MSATLLASGGSPPGENATELAVGVSACEVINDQGSGVMGVDRETLRACSQAAASSGSTFVHPTGKDSASCVRSSSSTRSRSKTLEQFNQRAKIDSYDDFVFIVIYGAGPNYGRLVEVHCYYSDRFLVTVHR